MGGRGFLLVVVEVEVGGKGDFGFVGEKVGVWRTGD